MDDKLAILDKLIEWESRRIREVPYSMSDARTQEHRKASLLLMRYMGKRDAYTYIKALLNGTYKYRRQI